MKKFFPPRLAFNRQKQTTRFQLTSRFVGLLTLLLLVVELAFAAITAVSTYQYVEAQGQQIADGLVKSAKDRPDWPELIDSYLSKQSKNAITLQLPNQERYASKDSAALFRQLADGTKLPFSKNLILTQGSFYYLKEYRYEEGYVFTIALNASQLLKLNGTILLASLLLNLLFLVGGSLLIAAFVKKWSRSLSQMTEEIQEVGRSTTTEAHLTVPPDPQELRETAQAFNQLLAQQKAALEREKNFVTNVSHELRTPLTTIRGHVGLIQRRGQPNPEIIQTSLGYIDSESKRMQSLITRLLPTHHLSEPPHPFDLVPLLREIVTTLQETISQRIQLQLPTTCFFTGNETPWQEILTNLLENAAKYSPKDGMITVTLEQTSDQKALQLTVADQGPGILPEDRQKIFERFFRADRSHSQQIPGNGLGLALVKDAVESLHGQVWVTDELPHGSRFILQIPMENEEIFT